jgi:hypothetical protein
MEREAMRFLNLLGNKVFGMLFSWTLEERISDTLCGTKVLRRTDYERIRANRAFFGDFDPFGDFDLLFGAAKLNNEDHRASGAISRAHVWDDQDAAVSARRALAADVMDRDP